MAIVIALIRGFVRRKTSMLGNFWVDMTRGTLYILLPLSLIAALVLVSQGVIQNFSPYKTCSRTVRKLRQPKSDAKRNPVKAPGIRLPKGWSRKSPFPWDLSPPGSDKEFGTNGGGFFNANSAHP
jgi:K+-transporting ATPase ATPase A chain